jgi:hypothetical protein
VRGLRSCVNALQRIRVAFSALNGVLVCAAGVGAQPSAEAMAHAVPRPLPSPSRRDSLPFGAGEKLTFSIHSSKFGNVGKAVMSLSGPVDVRGTATVLASFDASAGVMLLKGHDATRSWIDLDRMTSLRYEKTERRPFSSANDSVEIYPDLRLWQAAHGDSGSTASDRPLDELSFIYYLRTLTLAPDSVYTFDRHYDKRRLPTTVRMVKHDTITTPAGEFSTIEYEVRVVDARDFKEHGVLYFWISDDACRLPVRIESVMRLLGDGIMTLQSAVTPNCLRAEDKVIPSAARSR